MAVMRALNGGESNSYSTALENTILGHVQTYLISALPFACAYHGGSRTGRPRVWRVDGALRTRWSKAHPGTTNLFALE